MCDTPKTGACSVLFSVYIYIYVCVCEIQAQTLNSISKAKRAWGFLVGFGVWVLGFGGLGSPGFRA